MNISEQIVSRRRMIAGGAAAVAGGTAALEAAARTSTRPASQPSDTDDVSPILTPNGSTLPFRTLDGIKVFHLIAQPCTHEFMPGFTARCWGYNGSTPGPTIEAVQGDTVRIYVTNRLPAPTTVHWHGVRVPNGMDGVNGLTQKPIEPGQTYRYEFPLPHAGTYMYHPHLDEMTQQGLGMMGMFIVHPSDPAERRRTRVDRDFAIMLSEWRIDPGAERPDPIEMTDFNVLTMNSRIFPGTAPLVARKGDRVRIRFGNLSPMEHHPIHLHGYQFRVTETDGGRIPEAAQLPGNTILVPVGGTRAIEFVADAEGDWAMHCHMSHHTMNQMGHNSPNMVGVDMRGVNRAIARLLPGFMSMGETGMIDMTEMKMPSPPDSVPMSGGDGPFGTIDMGGMFTILKVRASLPSDADPGWYRQPPGTEARLATAGEMRRDGIESTG